MTATVTQKDIARKLGVSVTLVSRVLSGKAGEIGAAPGTIAAIRQTAMQMGYIPNAPARMLKGAPTRTLGVVVYDFEDPFLGGITGALHHLAHEQDYTLVLVGFEHRQADAEALRPLTKHRMDGLIIVGSGSDDDWLASFRDRPLRMVRIGHGPATHLATVCVDNGDGMDQLLGHLASRGCRSAGFVGGIHPAHQERMRHFARLTGIHAMATSDEWQFSRREADTNAGYTATTELIARCRHHLPRALITASDALAIGALRALQEHGIRVPGDIALTGFDDIPMAGMLTPSLTTIRQPVAAMARAAFEQVAGEPCPSLHTMEHALLLLKGSLIVREST